LKPGYKILIAIAIVSVGYNYYSSKELKKKRYTKEVNKLLVNTRREDYFAIQNMLDKNVSKFISIEDIKQYCNDLNLSKELKLVIKEISEDNNIIKINGIVQSKSSKLPLSIIYSDNNGTYLIVKYKLGTKELKAKNFSFPIK